MGWLRTTAAGLALALGGLLIAAQGAMAADGSIDFSGYADGTVLSTQYQPQGVTFGDAPSGPEQLQPLFVASSSAASSGKVAEQACTVEQCLIRQWIKFDPGMNHVSVLIGAVGTLMGPVTMTGYDAQGDVIASNSQALSSGSLVQMSVADPACTPHTIFICTIPIVFVSIAAGVNSQANGIQFSPLTFGPINQPATPDFSLHGSSSVVVQRGGSSVTDHITLRRFGGSNGPIAIAVSGLPPHVVPAYPTPVSGGDLSTFDVTFTADSSAAATTAQVTITGTPTTSSGSSPRSATLKLTVQDIYQLRIKGMEISQGVQDFIIPTPDPGNPGAPVNYAGVQLVKDMTTAVRVWADVPGAPPSGITAVTMTLSGVSSSGLPLTPGDLPEAFGPDQVGGGQLHDSGAAFVTPAERYNTLLAYEFLLPPSWSHGLSSLTATLHVPAPMFGQSPLSVPCSDPACAAASSFTVHGIAGHTRNVGTTPLATVIMTDHTGTPSSAAALSMATRLLPVHLHPLGDVGTIDIDWISAGCPDGGSLTCSDRPSRQAQAMSLLEDFYDNFDNNNGPPLVAVAPDDVGLGMQNLDLIDNGEQPLAQISVSNTLRGAAHEIGHMFGLPHASNECGGGKDNDSDDIGQVGESWPPDQRGFIGGVGLDPFVAAPFPVIGPGAVPASNQDLDFMSYCASGDPGPDLRPAGTAWISVRNWDYLVTFAACVRAGGSGDDCQTQAQGSKFFDTVQAPIQLAHASGDNARISTITAAPGSTRVYGFEDRAGTSLALIDSTPAGRSLRGIASPFGLEVMGSHGHVLSRSRMVMHIAHSDGAGGGPTLLLEGAVSMRPGASAIAITDSGRMVAIRHRPRHRPRVTLLPFSRMDLRGRGPLIVRWRATDPDRVHLIVSLYFSGDRGHHWKLVAIVPNSGRAKVSRSLVAISRRGRVRIRVSDGFDEAMAVSRPL